VQRVVEILFPGRGVDVEKIYDNEVRGLQGEIGPLRRKIFRQERAIDVLRRKCPAAFKGEK
jgi:hypothetical protein